MSGASQPGTPSAGQAGANSPQQSAASSGGQQGQGASSGNPGQGGQRSGSGSSSSQSGAGNESGTGQMPGGSGVRNPVGGGGNKDGGGNPGGGEPAKDESQPSPHAQEAGNFGNDDVAPAGQAQSGLQIRGLSDALKDASQEKELEQKTGLSKERLEQIAKKYEKPNVGAGRDAKDVQVKIGEQPAVGPASNLPGAKLKQFNLDKIRGRGDIGHDTVKGLNEGNAAEPPQEFRDRYSSYKSRLGRATKASPKGR